MPEEVLSQVFLPYFTTKAAGGGSGIGLAHVRRFVEGRGGAISIESERGVGTLVRLFLPCADDGPEQPCRCADHAHAVIQNSPRSVTTAM